MPSKLLYEELARNECARFDFFRPSQADSLPGRLVPSSARDAEDEYKATIVQMRSTLDTYRDQLASELAELRAQVCQTKTGEPSLFTGQAYQARRNARTDQ